MESRELIEKMEKAGVVPVIAIESEDKALGLADALIEGGLPVAEITFRTDAAAGVISKLKSERPQLLLGAGTILSVENLLKARDCGAVFGVSPGLNPEIVKKAVEMGLSFGINILKFFPSEAAGGTAMIKAVSAPYSHLGVRFIPTGGCNINNLKEYLEMPQVLVVGGTWIAKKEMISAEKWDQIRENAAQAVEIVKKVRG